MGSALGGNIWGGFFFLGIVVVVVVVVVVFGIDVEFVFFVFEVFGFEVVFGKMVLLFCLLLLILGVRLLVFVDLGFVEIVEALLEIEIVALLEDLLLVLLVLSLRFS